MADNDSNIIKPVEGLYNITGLTPTKRREQRKHRQNLREEEEQEPEQELNEPVDEQDLSELNKSESDENGIDYCA